jgi:hypothetical protein
MATAEELRRLREEQSIFSALYDMARQQRSELAAEGRRPVLGGLLSKEPTYGTDTLRYEGIGDMLAGLLTPAAKAVDAPISAMRGTIPQEDMISEALGVGGLAMAGGGAVGVPRGAVGANALRVYHGGPKKISPEDVEMRFDPEGTPIGFSVTDNPDVAEYYKNMRGGGSISEFDIDLDKANIISDIELYEFIDDLENKLDADASYEQIQRGLLDAGIDAIEYADPEFGIRVVNPSILAANASKSAGLLTTAASEAQEMAKRILDLRAQGRASEVTDEMMAQADPQYMFANTPLPMDEASRMARAEAAGFGVNNVSYHGTKAANLDRFNPEFMKEGLGGKVIYSTDTPKIASGYAGSDMPYDPTPIGSGILPLLLRGNRKAMPASDLAKGENLYFENVRKNIQAAKDEGFSGMDLQTTDPTGAKVQTTFEPRNIRSRFARFDPEFAHLSNLSAANVSPIGGLLAQSGVSDKQAERIEEYLRRRGLLD